MSNTKFNYEKNGKIISNIKIFLNYLRLCINNLRFTDSIEEQFMWLLRFATVKKIKDFLTKM